MYFYPVRRRIKENQVHSNIAVVTRQIVCERKSWNFNTIFKSPIGTFQCSRTMWKSKIFWLNRLSSEPEKMSEVRDSKLPSILTSTMPRSTSYRVIFEEKSNSVKTRFVPRSDRVHSISDSSFDLTLRRRVFGVEYIFEKLNRHSLGHARTIIY